MAIKIIKLNIKLSKFYVVLSDMGRYIETALTKQKQNLFISFCQIHIYIYCTYRLGRFFIIILNKGTKKLYIFKTLWILIILLNQTYRLYFCCVAKMALISVCCLDFYILQIDRKHT